VIEFTTLHALSKSRLQIFLSHQMFIALQHLALVALSSAAGRYALSLACCALPKAAARASFE
jgi:hypothetical protein